MGQATTSSPQGVKFSFSENKIPVQLMKRHRQLLPPPVARQQRSASAFSAAAAAAALHLHLLLATRTRAFNLRLCQQDHAVLL